MVPDENSWKQTRQTVLLYEGKLHQIQKSGNINTFKVLNGSHVTSSVPSRSFYQLNYNL